MVKFWDESTIELLTHLPTGTMIRMGGRLYRREGTWNDGGAVWRDPETGEDFQVGSFEGDLEEIHFKGKHATTKS